MHPCRDQRSLNYLCDVSKETDEVNATDRIFGRPIKPGWRPGAVPENEYLEYVEFPGEKGTSGLPESRANERTSYCNELLSQQETRDFYARSLFFVLRSPSSGPIREVPLTHTDHR